MHQYGKGRGCIFPAAATLSWTIMARPLTNYYSSTGCIYVPGKYHLPVAPHWSVCRLANVADGYYTEGHNHDGDRNGTKSRIFCTNGRTCWPLSFSTLYSSAVFSAQVKQAGRSTSRNDNGGGRYPGHYANVVAGLVIDDDLRWQKAFICAVFGFNNIYYCHRPRYSPTEDIPIKNSGNEKEEHF